MNYRLLFFIPALIWGSTWLVIKFQLGNVDPLVSVIYRFFLASIILLIYCKIRGLDMKFSKKDHLFLALQGNLLFGINYWVVYVAEQTIPSGIVALIFSSIVFLNSINSRIFLKVPIKKQLILAGIIGVGGLFLIIKEEITSFSFGDETLIAVLLAMSGAFLASLGNITSGYNQKRGIPVIQGNAYSMLYGGGVLFIVSLFLSKEFTFDFSFSYIASLVYLVVFGSIIAFTAYLTVLGKIGADRVAYVALIVPVIAMILSTIFEDYRWSIIPFIGVILVLIGNYIALKKNNTKI